MDNNLDDFGFSSSDKIEIIPNYKQKMYELYNAILPLLETLSKNPDKPTITWPDRGIHIEELKRKINAIVQSE